MFFALMEPFLKPKYSLSTVLNFCFFPFHADFKHQLFWVLIVNTEVDSYEAEAWFIHRKLSSTVINPLRTNVTTWKMHQNPTQPKPLLKQSNMGISQSVSRLVSQLVSKSLLDSI
jgi:hypothetical protein